MNTQSHKYTIKIAPSILAADFTRLGEQVQQAEAARADLIHIDIMDGRFVPNISMGPLVVEATRRVTKLPLDVHLMIVEPEKYIDDFAKAGADCISIHIEATPHVHRTLNAIQEAGCKAGIALNPHTSSASLENIMNLLDTIIVMTVNPGFGGQKFIPEMMSKVATIRAMIGNARRDIDLEVDGGINAETAVTSSQAGANVLIAGSSIFSAKHSVEHGISSLRQSLEQEMTGSSS